MGWVPLHEATIYRSFNQLSTLPCTLSDSTISFAGESGLGDSTFSLYIDAGIYSHVRFTPVSYYAEKSEPTGDNSMYAPAYFAYDTGGSAVNSAPPYPGTMADADTVNSWVSADVIAVISSEFGGATITYTGGTYTGGGAPMYESAAFYIELQERDNLLADPNNWEDFSGGGTASPPPEAYDAENGRYVWTVPGAATACITWGEAAGPLTGGRFKGTASYTAPLGGADDMYLHFVDEAGVDLVDPITVSNGAPFHFDYVEGVNMFGLLHSVYFNYSYAPGITSIEDPGTYAILVGGAPTPPEQPCFWTDLTNVVQVCV